MATTPPIDLDEVVQKSVRMARELQEQIGMVAAGTFAAESPLWASLVQMHVAHISNHTALLKHITSLEPGETTVRAILEPMIMAGERMVRDARTLNEVLLVSELRHARTSRAI